MVQMSLETTADEFFLYGRSGGSGVGNPRMWPIGLIKNGT